MKSMSLRTWIGTGFILLFCLNIFLVIVGLLLGNLWFTITGILVSIMQLWLHDSFARKRTTFVNYPFMARIRDFLSFLPASYLNIFFSLDSASVLTSDEKKVITKRARNIDAGQIPHSLNFLLDAGYECVMVSQNPVSINERKLAVNIGTGNCRKPYSLNLLTIASLNHETRLDKRSVLALSRAAKKQGCAVNTGVSGICPDLLRGGGDLIWRISRNDKECRDSEGSFDEAYFKTVSGRDYVKMIEVKILPEDIHHNRKVVTFHNMIYFLEKLKMLSGGKPIGICLTNPGSVILTSICKTMFATGIFLDFITIEDSRPLFMGVYDRVTKRCTDAFCFAVADASQSVKDYALPTKIIASADLVTEFDILKVVALGASACYSIQPFRIASDDGRRFMGNDIADKQSAAIANLHQNTVEATVRLMEACAYRTLDEVKAEDFYHRTTNLDVLSLDDIFHQQHKAYGKPYFVGVN